MENEYEVVRPIWFIKPNMNHPDDMVSQQMKGLGITRDMGGHYNGYIVVHKSHPWYPLGYDDIPYDEVNVHGGFTFANLCDDLEWEELDEQYRNSDYKCFGWDTCHYMDNSTYWTKEKTEEHTMSIAESAFMAHIKHLKLNNISDDS